MANFNVIDFGNKAKKGFGFDEDHQNLSVLQKATVTLTNAQLKALHSTPITGLAAQGAGKLTVVDSIVYDYDFDTAALATTAGVIEARYTGDTGVKVAADATEAFIESAADAVFVAQGASGVGVKNAPIVFHASAAITGAGVGTITATIFYRVV